MEPGSRTGTHGDWISSPAFEEEALWDTPKGGIWDELLGTLVFLALVAAGAAFILAG
ncbi:MAG: hypothetical protein HY654_02030 [Acidobacteria bacterium]|nr:hypothetical protein [Acidobacteriota bacterium]